MSKESLYQNPVPTSHGKPVSKLSLSRERDAEKFKGIGNKHMASQEYKEAYKAYSSALKLSPLGPSSHIFLSNRAAALLSIKQYSAASTDARRAITLAPTFGKAYARLGQSLYFLKDYKGAVSAYEDAVHYEPDNEVTWTYRDKARKKLKREEERQRRKQKQTQQQAQDQDNSSNNYHTSDADSLAGDTVIDSIIGTNPTFSVIDEDSEEYDSGAVFAHTKEHIGYNESDNEDNEHSSIEPYSPEGNKHYAQSTFGMNEIRAAMDAEAIPDEPQNQQSNTTDSSQQLPPKEIDLQPIDPNYLSQTKQHSSASICPSDEGSYHDLPKKDCFSPQVHTLSAHDEEQNSQKDSHGKVQNPQENLSHIHEVDTDNDTEDEEDPDFDEALHLQERATDKLVHKQYNAAVEGFSAALFLVPDDDNLTPQLYIGRAHALNGLRRHESAQNDAIMALARNPFLADAHAVMGRSLFYIGHYEAAVDSFQKCNECLDAGLRLTPLDNLYFEKAKEKSKSEQGNDKLDYSQKSSAFSLRGSITGANKPVPKLKPPRSTSRQEMLTSSSAIPPVPKVFARQVPNSPSALSVGPEREVIFVSEAMGVKLNRGPDGVIRVLSVVKEVGGCSIARQGNIYVGDVVREASGIDLRRPITKVMWGDTVALMKMSPRPMSIFVAKELSNPPPPTLEEFSKFGFKKRSRRKKKKVKGEDPKDVQSNAFFSESVMPTMYGGSTPPSRASGNESVKDAYAETQKLSPSLAVGTSMSQNMINDELRTDELVVRQETSSNEIFLTGKFSLAESSGLDQQVQSKSSTLSHDESNLFSQRGAVVDSDQAPDKNSSHNNERLVSVAIFMEPCASDPELAQSSSCDNTENLGSEQVASNQKGQGNTHLSDPSTSMNHHSSSLNDLQLMEINGKILFPPSKQENESSRNSASSHLFGWSQEKWLEVSSHIHLEYFSTISLLMKKRFFWSEDFFVHRKIAIFKNPELMIILRTPKNTNEIINILRLPQECSIPNEEINKNIFLDAYYIAETVIDLQTCKIRLSNLTTPTSIFLISIGDGDQCCKQSPTERCNCLNSCFEIITPSITYIMCPGEYDESKKVHLDSDNLGRSVEIEKTISNALLLAQSPLNKGIDTDYAWKHQIVLGSIHSYAVSANFSLLEEALANVQKRFGKLDSTVIDKRDEDGLTALHYACASRASLVVEVLVKAGCDCTIVTPVGNKSPCHLSAEHLDERSLSLMLSSKHARPDPNSLDSNGMTPMYLSCIKGKCLNVQNNANNLDHCLRTLEEWGGQIMLSENEMKEYFPNYETIYLPNPVKILSEQWKGIELGIVLNYSNFRYQYDNMKNHSDDCSMSKSAYMNYPIHSCLLSLIKSYLKLKKDKISNRLSFLNESSSLSCTLEVLLDHGFEPNERIDNVVSSKYFDADLNDFIGYTPLQILSYVVLITDNFNHQEDGHDHSEACSLFQSLLSCVLASAEILTRYGARISVDPPPAFRKGKKRESKKDLSEFEGISYSLIFPKIDKSCLKMDANEAIIAAFGGKKSLDNARSEFLQIKSVNSTSYIQLIDKNLSYIPDSNEPGGSDISSCALCWTSFGMVLDRKHLCRSSRRYVCEECSSKSVISNSVAHRVSDGQFNLAWMDFEQHRTKEFHLQQEKLRITNLCIAKANSRKESRSEQKENFPQRYSSNSDRSELFGGVFGRVKNYFEDIYASPKQQKAICEVNQGHALSNSLNRTKNAFNERGERLNSLSEKTAGLKDAASDFAKMAKELERSQRGGFFW